MFTETRQEKILQLVNEKGSITVQELTAMLETSESTIRRDLTHLHNIGALVKVFGGAIKLESKIQVKEERVSKRKEINIQEKQKIAEYAANLIEKDDFVYIDAGTTTGAMIPFLKEKTATYVTNAVSHALELAERDFKVILIGGEMKAATEAIVGNEAYHNLDKYNFTKGFWGTNGADAKMGFTTPDINEAIVKECGIKHTQQAYILCDSKKFEQIYSVRFAEFNQAIIITEEISSEEYKKAKNIIVV